MASRERLCIDDIDKLMHDSLYLSQCVDWLLSRGKDDIRRLTGNTTTSGYRRVYERIMSALDRALEICSARRGQTLIISDISEMSLMLTKGLIILENQIARNQLGRRLGNYMGGIIRYLVRVLRRENVKADEIMQKIRAAQMLLEAFTVIVHKAGREDGKEDGKYE